MTDKIEICVLSSGDKPCLSVGSTVVAGAWNGRGSTVHTFRVSVEQLERLIAEHKDRNAPHTAVQLAPVPAQPAEAEGVEALESLIRCTIDIEPAAEDEWGNYIPAQITGVEALAKELARRLRNSPESTGLLSLIADIRAAAGDPTGKLMQDELVVHIRALRKQAGRYRWLRDPSSPAYVEWIDCSHRNGIAGEALDDAIDAARSAGGDDA